MTRRFKVYELWSSPGYQMAVFAVRAAAEARMSMEKAHAKDKGEYLRLWIEEKEVQ